MRSHCMRWRGLDLGLEDAALPLDAADFEEALFEGAALPFVEELAPVSGARDPVLHEPLCNPLQGRAVQPLWPRGGGVIFGLTPVGLSPTHIRFFLRGN